MTAEQTVPAHGDILADRIGLLPQRMAASRRNPLADPVREIVVRIPTGTTRLATNDLDAPAEEIADLYRQRWQIELFFRWIKQNLKMRRFLGASENAVRTQVFVALIAYLLCAPPTLPSSLRSAARLRTPCAPQSHAQPTHRSA